MDHLNFVKDDGIVLPIDNNKYLFQMLSPTSPGTNYWESPVSPNLADRQVGRIILQCHQVLDIFDEIGFDLRGKSLLDIGTGNGLIPRLLLKLTELARATGIDPFLDGEHKTSWQPHDHDAELDRVIAKIIGVNDRVLSLVNYQDLATHEQRVTYPRAVNINLSGDGRYDFFQCGAHDMSALDRL